MRSFAFSLLMQMLIFTGAYCQFEENEKKSAALITDRPDQTESPFVLPSGAFQIEMGFSIESDNSGNYKSRDITYNTTLLRYGLSQHFELRFITEYVGSTVANLLTEEEAKLKGFSPVTVGTKIFMTEEDGFLPQIGFIGHLTFPSGDEAYKPSFVTPAFRFAFEHTLSDKLSLGYNLGAEWDGNTPEATAIYTLVLGISLGENAGFFVESYGFLPEKTSSDHRIDAGLIYALRNNIQLDISGGFGLSEISPDNFVSSGLSWRFPY